MGKLTWGIAIGTLGVMAAVSLHRSHGAGNANTSTVGAVAPDAAPSDGRKPVPSAPEQYRANETVKDLFRSDYADHSLPARISLARKLLKQGEATDTDAALQYACYIESRDLAAAAGDLGTSLSAIDALEKEFSVNAVDMRANAFATAAPLAPVEGSAAIAEAGFSLLDQAVAAENLPAAQRLLNAIDAAAVKSKELPLVAKVRPRRAELMELQKQVSSVRTAKETLKKDPADPAANLAVGRHLAFAKGDWERGLPMLAKGSDAALKALAQQDLAKPTASAARLQLADAWWIFSQQQTEPGKSAARLHAVELYAAVRPNLTGAEAARVDARLPSGASVTPTASISPPAPNKTVSQAPPAALDGKWPAVTVGPGVAGSLTPLRSLDEQASTVSGLQFAAGGRALLVRVFSSAKDSPHECHTYVVETGKHLARYGSDAAELSSDGRFLFEAGALHQADTGQFLKNYAPAPKYANIPSRRFSPGGSILAFIQEKKVHLIDPKAVAQIKEFGEWAEDPGGLAFSPDGRMLVTGGAYKDDVVRLWDIASARELWHTPITGQNIRRVGFCGDGTRIWTADAGYGGEQVVCVLDAKTGSMLASCKHLASPHTIALSPDGKLLLTAVDKPEVGGVRLWDVDSGKDLQRFPADLGPAGAAEFTPDGRRVLVGFADNTVRLFDVATGRGLAKATGHTGPVKSVAISPDGRIAASGSEDKTVRLWRLPDDGAVAASLPPTASSTATPTPRLPSLSFVAPPVFPNKVGLIRAFPAQPSLIRSVQISHDGRRVLSYFKDREVGASLFDTETGKEIATWKVYFASLLPDGQRIVLHDTGKKWFLASAETGDELSTLTATNGGNGWISGDGSRLLITSAATEAGVCVYDLKASAEIARLEGSNEDKFAIAPNGRSFVEGRYWTDFTMHARDTQTGKELWHGDTPGGTDGFSYSADSTLLIRRHHSASPVDIYDAKTGRLLASCNGKGSCWQAVLSSKNRFLVTARDDPAGGLKLFDLNSVNSITKEVKPMDWPAAGESVGPANVIALSADDRRVLVGCKDKTVRLFDVESGRQLAKFEGSDGEIQSVAFSDDGRLAVSGGDDKIARLWRLPDPPAKKK